MANRWAALDNDLEGSGGDRNGSEVEQEENAMPVVTPMTAETIA